MRIGIDCRLWNQTGVGRYTRNLVEELAQLGKENEYVLFVLREDKEKLKVQSAGWRTRFKIVEADLPWHGISEQIRFPGILMSENLDLMHFPYFSVPLFYNKPFVVTVHDLIVNRFNTGRASTLPGPIYLAKRAGYHAVMASAILRSKKIIVPSISVKNDILNTYKSVDPKKINVTYEGGFESEIKDQKSKIKNNGLKSKVEGRYLLRVGNFYPHKNVERLLLAFKEFLFDSDDKSIKLVLVGKKDYFYKRVVKEIINLKIDSNVVFLENVMDLDLAALYKNAEATIIPSLAEGFSLTAVEAMSMGSPVVASDIPVHREICDSAAIFFNAHDISEMKQKIGFVFSFTEKSRKELIEQGKKQSSKFSWHKMAVETLEVYNSCVV